MNGGLAGAMAKTSERAGQSILHASPSRASTLVAVQTRQSGSTQVQFSEADMTVICNPILEIVMALHYWACVKWN